ncbi:MAG: hypothetical protein LQ338_007074 [Usnochroma carphineum]|nr:MAG: hypothetical protein LQ338_007074 [Usnochroma carphineum]
MSTPHVPEHCEPTVFFLAYLSSAFNTCVPSPLALASTTLGILSIVSWLFAQLPQIIRNYTLGSASSLSVYFIAEWLLGDLTNFLGALLTRQAAWQVAVAAYYVTVDICMVTQYFWYSHYKPWQEKRLSDLDLDNDEPGVGPRGEVLLGVSPSANANPSGGRQAIDMTTSKKGSRSPIEPESLSSSLKRNFNFSWSPKEKATPSSSYRSIRRPRNSPSPGVSPNTMLIVSLAFAVMAKASPLHTFSQSQTTLLEYSAPPEIAGRLLSWSSTLLYLGSRLPQILKNHRRKSTSGLSPGLFIAAFFGNMFYSTSLLTNPLAWRDADPYGLHGWAGPEGSERMTWITLALPFFLGAAGVLIMDAIIGIQFLIFGEKDVAPKVLVVRDARGRSHWRKVSGWMRGWVPSPGPRRRDEVERPLLQGAPPTNQHRYGSS